MSTNSSLVNADATLPSNVCRMAAAAWGALSDNRYKALQRAAHLNPGVQLLPGNRAVLQLSDGSLLNVANSTPGVKLFWGCEGCKHGLQHYRYCTSHALGKAQALRCLYDIYDEGNGWQLAGRSHMTLSCS